MIQGAGIFLGHQQTTARLISDIAASTKSTVEFVLSAAHKLGINADTADSMVSSENTARITALIIPPPREPMAKPQRPRPHQPKVKQVFPTPGMQAEAHPATEVDVASHRHDPIPVPIDNGYRAVRGATELSYTNPSFRVTFAKPEPQAEGAMVPPKTKPRNKVRTVPSIVEHENPHKMPAREAFEKSAPVAGSTELANAGETGDTSELTELQLLLENFHPHDYGRFYELLLSALGFERANMEEPRPHLGSANFQPIQMPTEALELLERVCNYKYGVFAYSRSSESVQRQASKLAQDNATDRLAPTVRLRPMYLGLLTDTAGKRFIAWDIFTLKPAFVVLTFLDFERWLASLVAGSPIHLQAQYIDTRLPLTDESRKVVDYMAASALNLRSSVGYFDRRTKSRAGSKRLPSATSKNAHLGTRLHPRAHTQYLVPLQISDGYTSVGLDKDFFDGDGSPRKQKHMVRGFYRRRAGSSLDSVKDIFVQSHTRGGSPEDSAREILPAVSLI